MQEDEQQTEKMIQEKGLTAPRLCPADIDAKIIGKTFTKLPSGKAMICEITLANGFTVRGESACVSPANFDQEIGKKISFKNARDKVWQLEGYLLQEQYPASTVEPPAMTIGWTGMPIRPINPTTGVEYEDYQVRVIEERDQLNSKLEKLMMFLNSSQSSELSRTALSLLQHQRDAMNSYLAVLNERIADFGCF